MNKILLMGRLTDNPELKSKENTKHQIRFRLAVNNAYDNSSLFITVIAFDKLAEQCYQKLQKDSFIFIEGRLDLYQNKEKKTDYYSVVAKQVTFLKGLKENTETNKQVAIISTMSVKKEE